MACMIPAEPEEGSPEMDNYDREHLFAVLAELHKRGIDGGALDAAFSYFERHKNDEGVPLPFARVSRVRVEAFGAEPHTVQYVLYDHAKHFSKVLGETCVAWGEEVLERDLNFSASSDYAWKGRLILHCEISGGRSD